MSRTRNFALHAPLFLLVLGAQSIAPSQELSPRSPAFGSALAKVLGVDAYGMKKYIMALLKAGPNRNQDSATTASLPTAHLANIQRMAREGKLILAGPFLDDTDLKGIYVFNVESVEAAKALIESDLAIKVGRLIMELHPWYGSAALHKVPEIHGTIQRQRF